MSVTVRIELMEIVKNLDWQILLEYFLKFWNYALFIVDGNSISIGTLFFAVIFLVCSYFFSRKISNQIEHKLLSRFEIDNSIKHTLNQISFYLLLIVFTLLILNFLNIPITIFTVIGGAVAIGVGFGSQNIVNNFMSGLIIMMERPIRVGDLIQIDELHGTIEDIGARATRIKSFRNTHIVVPNSTFLESNVLNWTLSDDVVRSIVNVGVNYGSNTRLVEEVLIEAAMAQTSVLKYPEPMVLFQDFGDNSLNFEIHYFSRVRNYLQMQKLASDMRFKIDELFHEKDLVIAFPQRDVHLDAKKPIPVTILK